MYEEARRLLDEAAELWITDGANPEVEALARRALTLAGGPEAAPLRAEAHELIGQFCFEQERPGVAAAHLVASIRTLAGVTSVDAILGRVPVGSPVGDRIAVLLHQLVDSLNASQRYETADQVEVLADLFYAGRAAA